VDDDINAMDRVLSFEFCKDTSMDKISETICFLCIPIVPCLPLSVAFESCLFGVSHIGRTGGTCCPLLVLTRT